MKLRNFFYAAFAAMLVLVGCEKEQESGGKIQKPVTQINKIQSEGTYNVLGTIAAVANNYYIMTDGTANIAIYTADVDLKIGDKVLVEGSVQRGKDKKFATDAWQFASPSCTKVSSGNQVAHSPKEYDGQMVEDALGETCTCPEVKFSGKLYKNGNFYNIYIKGTSKLAGLYNQVSGSWDEWDGKNVIVKGYLAQQYNYFNVVPYDVVEDQNPALFITSISTTELNFPAEGGDKTINIGVTTESGWELSATSNNEAFTASVSGKEITVTAAQSTALVNAILTIELKANGNVVDSREVKLSQSAPIAEGNKEVVIDFPAMNYENQTPLEEIVRDGLTLTFDAGGNSNGPKYFTSGTAARLYAKNSVTITGGTINTVKLTFGSSDGENEIIASAGTFDAQTGIWTGSTPSLTLTIGGETGNRRIQKITVVYLTPEAGGEVTKTSRNLAFSNVLAYVVIGGEFAAPTLSGKTDGVVYSSSNEEVAAVESDSGAVTINAVGTAVITASAGESDTLLAGEASYTINVVEAVPAGPLEVSVYEFLAAAESDVQEYKLTGVVENLTSTEYGNFNLNDQTGTVYVYGLTSTKQEKNDKSFAQLGIKAGDTVTLIGYRSSHNSKAQVANAYYVSHVAAPYVNVATSATVNADVATYTIEVQSNTAWTATASEGVTLDPASGNGNASVVMTFAANAGEAAITHSVTFAAGDISKTFTLTQRAPATGGDAAQQTETKTWSYTFANKKDLENLKDVTVNNLSWTQEVTFSNPATPYWKTDNAKGVIIGKADSYAKYFALKTSAVPGTIKKVKVTAQGAKDTAAKLNVSVGGIAYGTQQTITNAAADYVFEGTSSGELVVSFTQGEDSQKAIYLKTIEITYEVPVSNQ